MGPDKKNHPYQTCNYNVKQNQIDATSWNNQNRRQQDSAWHLDTTILSFQKLGDPDIMQAHHLQLEGSQSHVHMWRTKFLHISKLELFKTNPKTP